MPTPLNVTFSEKGTGIIIASFSDENDSGIAPNWAVWDLGDINGNIVNGRSSVAISSPTSQESIVLSSADLSVADSLDNSRILTVRARYNSADHGDSLPLHGSCIFSVDNLKMIT